MKMAGIVLLAMLFALSAVEEKTAIDVEVVDGRRANCPVYVAVYREAKTWLSESPLRYEKGQMQMGLARLTVEGLAPGKYALFGFCDLNGNGKLDENLLRIPKEPFGFSNGQPGKYEPTFEESAIVVRLGAKEKWQIELVRP